MDPTPTPIYLIEGDVVIIGGITLTIWQTPSEMAMPSQQMLNKHVMVGGQRQIDAMGPDPEVLGWRGLSRGSNASANMAALKALCNSGATVPLTWNAFFYMVKVASFTPVYMRTNEWHYDICCEVVVDASSGASVPPGLVMLDSLVSLDLSWALLLAGL